MFFFCPFPMEIQDFCIKPVTVQRATKTATGINMIRATFADSGKIFMQEASMFGATPEQAIAHSFYGLLIAKARYQRLSPRLALGLIAGDADPGDEDDIYETWIEEKPYLPSNSTDGYAFTSRYCEHCEKDATAGPEGCEILALALIGEQPEEWRWLDAKPTCTAFEPKRPKKRKPKESPGQLNLF
jgi:hypothetical protein